MKSLLHAAAVVLTLLLFLIRPPGTLAAVCYKRLNAGHRYYPDNLGRGPPLSPMDKTCNAEAYYVPPKYKRDPEIDVDNEQIGHHPLV